MARRIKRDGAQRRPSRRARPDRPSSSSGRCRTSTSRGPSSTRPGIEYQAADALPLAAEPMAAVLDLVCAAVESRVRARPLVALLRSPHLDADPLGRAAIGGGRGRVRPGARRGAATSADPQALAAPGVAVERQRRGCGRARRRRWRRRSSRSTPSTGCRPTPRACSTSSAPTSGSAFRRRCAAIAAPARARAPCSAALDELRQAALDVRRPARRASPTWPRRSGAGSSRRRSRRAAARAACTWWTRRRRASARSTRCTSSGLAEGDWPEPPGAQHLLPGVPAVRSSDGRPRPTRRPPCGPRSSISCALPRERVSRLDVHARGRLHRRTRRRCSTRLARARLDCRSVGRRRAPASSRTRRCRRRLPSTRRCHPATLGLARASSKPVARGPRASSTAKQAPAARRVLHGHRHRPVPAVPVQVLRAHGPPAARGGRGRAGDDAPGGRGSSCTRCSAPSSRRGRRPAAARSPPTSSPRRERTFAAVAERALAGAARIARRRSSGCGCSARSARRASARSCSPRRPARPADVRERLLEYPLERRVPDLRRAARPATGSTAREGRPGRPAGRRALPPDRLQERERPDAAQTIQLPIYAVCVRQQLQRTRGEDWDARRGRLPRVRRAQAGPRRRGRRAEGRCGAGRRAGAPARRDRPDRARRVPAPPVAATDLRRRAPTPRCAGRTTSMPTELRLPFDDPPSPLEPRRARRARERPPSIRRATSCSRRRPAPARRTSS